MIATSTKKLQKEPRFSLRGKTGLFLQIALIIILILFLIVPLLFLLFKATSDDFSFIFGDSIFYSALGNSLLYSFCGALIAVILGTITAYLLSRLNIKGKKFLVGFLTIPMLIPTISIGLGVRILFQNNGFVQILFGLKFDGIGMFDLIFGSAIFAFPIAFLLVYDALLYEDRTVYDCAYTLGIPKLRSFFGLTLPYLRRTIIAAFISCFVLIFADYGLPMEVAGRIKTLPMYLYEQVVSTFDYGRGAIVSMVLLLPALVSFFLEAFGKEVPSETVGKEHRLPSKAFTISGVIILIVVGVFLEIPQISFIVLSFVRSFPNDLTFTFDHFINAFSPFAAVNIIDTLLNSLIMSVLAAFFGTIIAYLSGYAAARSKGKLSKVLNILAAGSLAVPGLALGLGYIFVFGWTSGWFYGTITILVTVNIVHYFSSPYLMAKTAFGKLNSNFEDVASTLGISKVRLFFSVLVPNTIPTLFQMFSYFFVNSMVTISAVSFLCNYATQPLSVSISSFGSLGDWEMAAVVSFIILCINIVAKTLLEGISSKISFRNIYKKGEHRMGLSKFEFALLTYLEEHQGVSLTQRTIADATTFSLGLVNKLINHFEDIDVIVFHEGKSITLTEKGYKLLEPYLVRKAIIIAAGFGSRMAPVTLDTPKPLVTVNGVRIIDTLLDALLAKGINSIFLVRGYKAEQFDQLLEKYPMIRFIDNPLYNESNNISSLYAAMDVVDRCYICEADLIVHNPEVIKKYQYSSNYLATYVAETDDWCFLSKGGYISEVKIGGEAVEQMVGISYWDSKDSEILRADIDKVFHARGGKENYWDNVPLKICRKDFKIAIRECERGDISEIDNFSELVMIDPSYVDYKAGGQGSKN